ncbi:MAG: Hsp20/alpha crystallin family protein [Deltaproteobacteria bacterium]|nr:Hsp20/alpha crystallin family protein [Deltaproteobacteria bacterium]
MGKKRTSGKEGGAGFGSLFQSFGSFVDFLSDLAEKAEESGGEFTRKGEVGDDKKVKAVYGFSVKIGGGKPLVESFGNVKRDGGRAFVEEAREPIVDLFDEGDHLLVVAELPGVSADDVRFDVKDDVLTLSATCGDRKYRKEMLLPPRVSAEGAKLSFRNGVCEIKFTKVP